MTAYNIIDAAKLAPGEPEDISVVVANLQAIANILNGGLDNANLNPAAALAVSKLQAGIEGYKLVTQGGVPTWVSDAISGLQLTYLGDYVPAATYQDGDVVVKDNMTYLCVGGPTIVAPDITPWGASGQGPKGDTGAQGPPGTNGTNGEKWFTGSGAPAGSLAGSVVGDWYLNSANGDYYEKTGASAWTLRGNLRGPQGPAGADSTVQGPQGNPGTPGEKWFSGSGAPAGGTGIVGDWYVDSATGNFYEKTGTSTWTQRGNFLGPQGPAGPTGADGPVGPSGMQSARTVELMSPGDSASAAATNLAVNTVNAVSDPNYRRMLDLRALTKVKIQARIGGTLVAATKIRIQYHTAGNVAVATGDAGWTTLADSAGSHTAGTMFYSAELAVPAGAQINDCLIRCVLFSGDGAADPTITACVLNFYA